MTHPDSTEPPESPERATRVDLAYRRALIAFSATVLLAALLGLLGVREAEATASASGYELTVRHASVSRPGLATPFDVTVGRNEALPEEIVLEVSANYLAAFDENGLDPQPTRSFSDGERERWLFEVPAGEHRLTVSFDARLEPSVQWTRTATVRLLVEGEEVTVVELRTWVMP
jgi:hypothetical protein